jgi:hypothetical protein
LAVAIWSKLPTRAVRLKRPQQIGPQNLKGIPTEI